MARPKKDNQPVTVRLDKEIYDRLNDFCKRSGQSKTTAVERALAMYMDNYDQMMKKIEEAN